MKNYIKNLEKYQKIKKKENKKKKKIKKPRKKTRKYDKTKEENNDKSFLTQYLHFFLFSYPTFVIIICFTKICKLGFIFKAARVLLNSVLEQEITLISVILFCFNINIS